MKRGEEIEIDLESFAFEGKSVARLDGLVVFVLGGVPGDRARVRLTKVKKSFCEGVVTSILRPSSLRVDPPCRHFGPCGGCTWQNVSYTAQLEFKRQHVRDALERIGGFRQVEVRPTIGVDDPFWYRNKMEYSFGVRWLTAEELGARADGGRQRDPMLEWGLGLHIPGRFDRVLDLLECRLQSEISASILNAVRRFCRERALTAYSTLTHTGYLRNLVIRQSRKTGGLMVNLVTRDDRPDIMRSLCIALLAEFPQITTVCNNITERKSQVAVGDREVVYHGDGTINERIGKRTYRISSNSFFQTNTEQAERLYETVRGMARGSASDVVYDLYSGTGTIALHLADDVRSVVGFESVPSAIDDARRNAAANGVSNCLFVPGDLRETLARTSYRPAEWGEPDVMVLDPPRAGMHGDVVQRVLEIAPERIVYISCNPATQARDLALLAGSYRIRGVQPVDMFPHTTHIENVVELVR